MEVLLGIIGILLEQIFPPIEGHGEGEWISERRIGGDGMQQEKKSSWEDDAYRKSNIVELHGNGGDSGGWKRSW